MRLGSLWKSVKYANQESEGSNLDPFLKKNCWKAADKMELTSSGKPWKYGFLLTHALENTGNGSFTFGTGKTLHSSGCLLNQAMFPSSMFSLLAPGNNVEGWRHGEYMVCG